MAVAAVALAAAPSALAATPAAEVRGPDGTLIAAANRAPFAYPADGSVLRIAGLASTPRGLELRGVSLLGGAVRADTLLIPARGLAGAAVRGLAVAGRRETGQANTVHSLGGPSYVVVLQEAVLPGSPTGVVGLRAYVGDAQRGVPAGTQILVGLARAAVAAPAKEAAAQQPWQVLGVVPLSLPSTTFPGVPDPFAELRGASPIGERAVALAEQLLGVPYVWGGAKPAEGFDCSGLVMFVYRQLGIGLPHFSGSQWYSGPRIAADGLEPGDLVFFDMGPNGPGHVGLYIGDGRFIEAPHSGAAVRISSLLDPARGLSYVGAVRPY